MNAYQPPPLRASVDSGGVTGPDPAGDWMSELGLAYEEAGDGLVRGGYRLEAAEKYASALCIFERMASRNPKDRFAVERLRQIKGKID